MTETLGLCGECTLPVEPDDPHGMVDDDGQAWHISCAQEWAERNAYFDELEAEKE